MYTLHYFLSYVIYPSQKTKMLNPSLFQNFIYKIFLSVDGFATQFYKVYQTESKQEIMGPVWWEGSTYILRGPGEKPSWRETRSSGTGIPDQSPGGEVHIPYSLAIKRNQEGGPPGWTTDQVETGGPHPGVEIFPDLSPRTKPYCGVRCQGLHFPATSFIGKQGSSFTSQESTKECNL